MIVITPNILIALFIQLSIIKAIGGSPSCSSHNLHFWRQESCNKGLCLVGAISWPDKHNTSNSHLPHYTHSLLNPIVTLARYVCSKPETSSKVVFLASFGVMVRALKKSRNQLLVFLIYLWKITIVTFNTCKS